VIPLWLSAAEETDLDALLRLERACFSHPWTKEHFRSELADPGRGRLVVLRGLARRGAPAVVGYCAFHVVADEGQILTLAVAPAAQRQGLGGRLLRVSLALMARRGAASVFLDVREGNHAARALYAAHGFEIVGVRAGYYSEPAEGALLLRLAGLPPLS
jgi:ribosomal-protein-alanine N-acetyltransferase